MSPVRNGDNYALGVTVFERISGSVRPPGGERVTGHLQGSCAMDVDSSETRTPDQGGRSFPTGRLVAVGALGALVLVAVGLKRRLRFVREVFRHRRRLQLAFTVLLLLRKLRKELQ